MMSGRPGNTIGGTGGGIPIPVIMYHSVGRVLPDWHWSILTVPWWTFEDHLKWLAASRYRPADLGQLYDHVSGTRTLDPMSVVLSFDDGYLDNWTYAFPLLKKYGFKGTVCVSPEFVDPRDIVRPTLEDARAGRVDEGELEVRGFMSWPEMKRAVEEGVLSIESHTMTHTWYPVGPEVVDFHRPGDGHFWLDWNADVESKPFYLREPLHSAVPWGVPVYRHAKALEATRFFPDPSEAERLGEFVAANGGAAFFEQTGWRKRLEAELSAARAGAGGGGRMETPRERRERVDYELLESKRLIEDRLGVPVGSVFWPGGGYSDEALEVALDIYKSVTWSKQERWRMRNTIGDDPSKVSRRGVPFIENSKHRIHTGGRYLKWFLEEYRGVPAARKKRQALKLLCMAGATLGMWPSNKDERIALWREDGDRQGGSHH
jgi:hypothetical protein